MSLIPLLCAKVLLVLAEPGLSHLRVLRHVGQRVGADDVAVKTEFFISLPAFALKSKAVVPCENMNDQLLHDVVELQHGVGRRVDEDVGQRVLMVVHFVYGEERGETAKAAQESSYTVL